MRRFYTIDDLYTFCKTNHFEKFIDHYNSQPISEIEFAGNKLVVIFYLQLAYEYFTPLGETIYG